MFLSDVSIRRPVFATMVTVGLMVLGGVGYSYLGVDLFPDVSFPVVVIATPYPGAGPQEVETLITKPIEDGVSSIRGVDKVRSYSREGLSTVVIEFTLETPIKEAAEDVRDRMGTVRALLPEDILEPVITRVDPDSIPIVTYTLSGPQPPQELRRFADKELKPRLEQIDGVGGVNILGGLEREIQLNVDLGKLEAYGLSLQQVAALVGGENINLPAGRLESGKGEITLRTLGEFQSVEEIGNVALASVGGTQVLVRDILAPDPTTPGGLPRVTDGFEEVRTMTRTNGEPSVSLQIQKQSGTNTVAIVEEVKKRLDKLSSILPPGAQLSLILDQSEFILENQHEVNEAILFGGAMAILIIFVFMLDWRSTVISALALPTSVVATFFFMYLLGFSLNMMSMMALSLAIGLLIDDAVVVRENIFRHMEMGKDPKTAASQGTSEIGLAVTATTLTIVAVFVPVAFMEGMIGKFFKEFGLTVTAAVLVSLFVAFTLDPMLSAYFVKKFDKDRHAKLKKGILSGPILFVLDGIDSIYRVIIGWSLRWRFVVVLLAIFAFASSLFVAGQLGGEFIPTSDRGQFVMNIEFPPGTTLDQTAARVAIIEGRLLENPLFKTLFTTIGPNEEANKATIHLIAVSKNERSETLNDLREIARAATRDIPDLRVELADVGLVGGGQQAPITLYIQGPDLKMLEELAERVTQDFQESPYMRDVVNTYGGGRPERQITIDRQRLADLGLSTAQVALELRAATTGVIAGKFRDGEDEYDIRVQADPALRQGDRLLEALSFRTRSGKTVKLQDVIADDPTALGPSSIERLNRQRQIAITAYPSETSTLGEAITQAQKVLDTYDLPEGYRFYFGGEAEELQETTMNMLLALGLAIIFIYIVLASQFESFVHPFTIMMSLPMSFIGAALGLYLGGFSLSMPAMIGIVLLMGLVTKNGILLVDYTNQLRDQGMSRTGALLKACPTRLRPILMTSMAMIVGMLPSALLQERAGSEFRAPMAIAVIGGVISSTVLTLLVVPVVYTFVDWFTPRGFREWKEARRARKEARAAKKVGEAQAPSEEQQSAAGE